MGIVHTKWSARATLIAALTMFGSIATARSTNATSTSAEAHLTSILIRPLLLRVSMQTREAFPPAPTSCSVNVVAQQGQQYLWLRYQEVWFDTEGSTALVCGGGSGQLSCADTVTITITGPNLSDITTLSGAGTTIPLTDNGPAWEVLNSDPSFGQIWAGRGLGQSLYRVRRNFRMRFIRSPSRKCSRRMPMIPLFTEPSQWGGLSG